MNQLKPKPSPIHQTTEKAPNSALCIANSAKCTAYTKTARTVSCLACLSFTLFSVSCTSIVIGIVMGNRFTPYSLFLGSLSLCIDCFSSSFMWYGRQTWEVLALA